MVVGVIGVGGLGHVALQFTKALGCTPIAISRGESKKEEALGFGAEGYVASSIPEQMSAAKGSMDVILNTSSGVSGMDEYFALLKPRGVMAMAGLPEKDEANKTKLFLHSLVPTEKTLVGTYLGPLADYADMFATADKFGVKPMVEVVPLAEANVAIQRVKDGSARYRMVLAME
eukprot:TRINITY_DN25168_c0_g1_i1.p1 TRINITY_DN25168_c0_g1~~TRINITY_DN25168_c0_g1_i1.p1  ORF type:complete len:174 (+),score=51.66 TRINITY_DN25168_c0_g1_i1:229-750(+)